MGAVLGALVGDFMVLGAGTGWMPRALTLRKWEKLLLFLSWSICVWSGEGKLPVLGLWGILSISDQCSAIQLSSLGIRAALCCHLQGQAHLPWLCHPSLP